VHQLWSEADASARGDLAEGAPGLEPVEAVEARLRRRALVGVDAQLAVAELADEQLGLALALEVGDARGGVADVDVDRLAGRQKLAGRGQPAGGGRAGRGAGRGKQQGR